MTKFHGRTVSWGPKDVKAIAPDLTDEQVEAFLNGETLTEKLRREIETGVVTVLVNELRAAITQDSLPKVPLNAGNARLSNVDFSIDDVSWSASELSEEEVTWFLSDPTVQSRMREAMSMAGWQQLNHELFGAMRDGQLRRVLLEMDRPDDTTMTVRWEPFSVTTTESLHTLLRKSEERGADENSG